MSDSAYPSLTQHAMLVAWGQYVHCLGLVAGLEAVSLRQKAVKHRPQTKVIEFLVAILGGLPHLKDLSRSAHALDLALKRFHTGQTLRHSVLLYFGDDPVTDNLPEWFGRYNGRQTIEAGIKQGKQVFQMHHLKVRSQEALYLQEQFAVLAANFVRWAAHWLATQCSQLPDGWQEPGNTPVKEQVQVAAHTSAWITWHEQGCLLTFTNHSVFAGRSLQINREWVYQRVLPFTRSCVFSTIRAP